SAAARARAAVRMASPEPGDQEDVDRDGGRDRITAQSPDARDCRLSSRYGGMSNIDSRRSAFGVRRSALGARGLALGLGTRVRLTLGRVGRAGLSLKGID